MQFARKLAASAVSMLFWGTYWVAYSVAFGTPPSWQAAVALALLGILAGMIWCVLDFILYCREKYQKTATVSGIK